MNISSKGKEKIIGEFNEMISNDISFIANVKKNMPNKHWYKRRFIAELEKQLASTIKTKNKIEKL